MSSLRNAVQRRNHRERAQPEERAKWGLLEKRKDYKLRAADHKLKKRKINALRQKASERNEDEFYFGMMSSSSRGGIRQSRRGEENAGGGGKALSMDVVKLMKTQDQGYLQTMLQRTRKEVERLGNEVIMGGHGVKMTAKPGKILYGDAGEIVFTPPTNEELPDEDLNRTELDSLNDERTDHTSSADENSDEENPTSEQQMSKRQKMHDLEVKRKKLMALQQQQEKLATALEQLEQQRARMNGCVGGSNKNGTKFKMRERKR